MKVVAIENITLAVAGTPAAEVIPLLSSVLAQFDNTSSENAAQNAPGEADSRSTLPTTLTSAATTPTSETLHRMRPEKRIL
jgi:antitoxin (DNA-binding transcriptional repressor) of toxin-antitoxin stability system